MPEGIIFQSGNAYKTLRKNLIDGGLYAVVSLPSGVFQPYSGVKTSVLLLNKKLAKQSSELLFIKIENDGFDLGAQRRSSAKNDLPQALEILQKWQIGEKLENKMASFVEKEKIAENGDYNLSGDRYRITTDYSKAKWPMVELGEVCDIINGSTPKRTESKYWENGNIPWFTIEDIRKGGRIITSTQQKITETGLKESSVKLLPKNTTLLCCTASVGEYAYSEIELTTNQQFNGLVIKSDCSTKIIPKFLFWCVTTFKDELDRMSGKATFGFIPVGTLKKFKIPLPPLEVQEQIVRELNGYQSIIQGAKQITQNWKPKIDIDPSWPVVLLEEASDIQRGKFSHRPRNEPRFYGGKYPFIQTGDIVKASGGKIEFSQTLNEEGLLVSKLFQPPIVVITIAANIGDTAVLDFPSCFPDSVVALTPKSEVDVYYLELVMQTKKQYLNDVAPQAAQKNINIEILKTVKIPLPSLEIQQEIVAKIESERALVKSAKKLIEIYEQKTKATINKLWEE